LSKDIVDKNIANGLEKIVYIPNPKAGDTRECSNNIPIALISHARKVILKILQSRMEQVVNRVTIICTSRFQKEKMDKGSDSKHTVDLERVREHN